MHFLKIGFSFGGPLEQILPNDLWVQSGLPSAYSPPSDMDSHFMLEALKVSLSSVGISNPNPAVGCVLVDAQGNEISRGATEAYLGAHAERDALSKISDPKRLEGATAYVTLEPCSHHGNQPPCVDLFTSSKIRRVVIARADPNPLVSGEGIRKLLASGKEVSIGLHHAEATAWNFPFFAYQTVKRPIFALKWAQTLDGQLADDQGNSKWITGPVARSYTHWLRQRYDALLVGAGTVLADFPKLTVRDCGLPHQAQPLPIIFDPKGKLLEISQEQQDRLLRTTFAEGRKFVYVTSAVETSSYSRLSALTDASSCTSQNSGATRGKANKLSDRLSERISASWLKNLPQGHLLLLPLPKSTLEPRGTGTHLDVYLIQQLAVLLQGPELTQALGRPLQSIMIEGGPKTLSLFLQAGYADLLHVFLAPMLSGGDRNRIRLMDLFACSKRFELISNFRLGPDIVMEMVSAELQGLFTETTPGT